LVRGRSREPMPAAGMMALVIVDVMPTSIQ
jgi:hypothetical protein